MADPRRYRKAWKQPKEVSSGVGSVLDKLSLGTRLVEMRVCRAWAEAVGDSIARRSTATTLERGTLHVVVESPTWRNELVFVEKDIVRRVNACYAEEVPPGSRAPVKRLRLTIGVVKAAAKRKAEPAEPPAPGVLDPEDARHVEERLRGIQDPEVREAARGLLLRSLASDRRR